MKTVAIVLFGVLMQAAAQQPPTGSIQGIVVSTETGMPLSKVTVDLLSPAGNTSVYTTRANADGRFFLPNIAPGKYRLVAARAGYVKAEFEQRLPGGPSLDLVIGPGQRMTDIRLSMVAGGVVSGRVTDKGQPVGIADVVAMKPVYNDGQTTMVPVLTDRTNDLGEYHIFWLPPGRYHIAAVVWDTASRIPYYITPDGSDTGDSFYAERRAARAVLNRAIGSGAADNESHVPIYFPGTPDPERAAIVDVKAGSDIRNIDIQADALITRRVRGRITGAPSVNTNGQPVLPQVGMLPLVSSFVTGIANAQVDATGAFDIQRVVPGRYVLYALSRGSVGNVTGRTLVDVNTEDVNGVVVNLAPSIELTGRVVIERQPPAAGPDPALSALGVVLRTDPMIPGVPTGTSTPGTDGTFRYPTNPTAPPLQTGTYRVLVNPILIPALAPGATPPNVPVSLRNAYVKSIRFGSEDVLNGGLRVTGPSSDEMLIVIGTNPGAVEGRVINGAGQPVKAATVVMIPEGGLKFRIDHKFAFTDTSGMFQIQNTPPGDYQVYAFEQIEKGGWQDPRVMGQYEGRGKPIRVDEGGKATLDVVAIPGS
ncbi:MAG TPA: carboxypeptidase regulatory-like domain-containing protein [Terriglobia bacterium]|nr:carboxypeptidase regulatory-like domain-containing protein [Terriglobia bacterium]